MLRREFLIALFLPMAACSAATSRSIEFGDQNESHPIAAEAININTASIDELQRIPHIGESMAQRIIERREKYGPFKRPEHLMLLKGMSDIRFRRIRHLVRVE